MTQSNWQRTKIVCTLGPATDRPGVIERLIEAGMDVARINTSHGDHADHARRIRQVRQAAHALGQPVALLMDLPGPKFRLADLPNGFCKLEEGTIVRLVVAGDEAKGASADNCCLLPVRSRELLQALRIGEPVFLADGSVELGVKSVTANPSRADCQVRIGGTVRSGSGINIPESATDMLIPTDEDRRHLAFAVSQEAEWVGVSFVQSAGDLARVRACLSAGPGIKPLLMAKIEKRRALDDLDAIVAASDGVMVARGDLGVETDLAEIPIVQKRIISVANAQGRPVITATQMLESMVEHEHPTRAEVTDVANAVLDGTDAVMLSAETAVGEFPVAAVRFLQRVLTATEEVYGGRMARDRMNPAETASPNEAGNALSFAACLLAARLGARAIIAPVQSMETALSVARFRPQAPLVMVADSVRLYRSLALVRGISPLVVNAPDNGAEPQARLAQAREWLFTHGLAQEDDLAVLLSASGAAGDKADTLQTVRLNS
ncbi:pyruvate kinase [Nitrosospira sp. NRS527]|uniref:pyruvate kinase n=1 Tax=Nitrosospira sp. NRS527 TaxID=155925 RepID=UPI001AF600CF|nr:pyruvate kinase [Nitrosospira sp. NRS527]BCT68038.1 Pyruvate kinase [Nitrosospira sp. NRS527]